MEVEDIDDDDMPAAAEQEPPTWVTAVEDIDDYEIIDDDVPLGLLPRGVSKKLDPPAAGPLQPSLTRKRKGKQLQPVPFDLSARPEADGLWHCKSCEVVYETRAALFGHARFCEAVNAWQCEWCKATAGETHHKGNGPNGPKTLCSACSQRFRSGHNAMPAQNDKG